MGKPTCSHVQVPPLEYIERLEGTPGSETSQYRQEEKTIVIPRVVASESGFSLNRWHVIPVRGCDTGVVRHSMQGLTVLRVVIKFRVSRSRVNAAP
jgi:hypothetical protein